MPELYPLAGAVRDYPWGSPTAIPELIGVEPTGRPMAELWLGAHADDSARIAGTDTSLLDLIGDDPARLLGSAVLEEFGPRLPFLLKVLAAEHALSIQVHPNLAQAEAGFAAEDARGVPRDAPERNYRDPNHKPELLCALTEFDALCGFRPIADTLRLLAELPAEPLAPIAALLAGPDGLRAAFTAVLALDAAAVEAVVAVATGLTGEWAPVGAAVAAVAADYPGDVGLVLMLLLNLVRLGPGEAIYLGAGNVHAYLRGVGVEIMASSDNVLRCGLTAKHIDVAELLRITDFTPLTDPRCPVERFDRERRFDVPVADFSLSVLTPGEQPMAADQDGPQILLCTDGVAAVRTEREERTLAAGQALFVAAGVGVLIHGPATLHRGTVPTRLRGTVP